MAFLGHQTRYLNAYMPKKNKKVIQYILLLRMNTSHIFLNIFSKATQKQSVLMPSVHFVNQTTIVNFL